MDIRFILFVVLLTIVESNQEKLKVTIFYESLCSDSQKFINEYFTPAVALLGPYIDLEYVPYGQASYKRNNQNSFNFKCQHGSLECYGNKVQACAIAASDCTEKTIDFVDCAMAAMHDRNIYENKLKSCSYQSGICWNTVHKCANSANGCYILARLGKRTKSTKLISFLPTVVVNDKTVVVRCIQDFPAFFARVCDLFTNKPGVCYRNIH